MREARNQRSWSRGTGLSLVLTVLLGAPSLSGAEDRQHLLEWLVPPEPDVAGYVIYLAPGPAEGLDVGLQEPDPSGVASVVVGLDPTVTYSIDMTAYNQTGVESARSNSILIAAVCSHEGCDDQNPCTVDRCEPEGCRSTFEPDGSSCPLDAGEGVCTAGQCQPLPGCTTDLECSDGEPCNGDERCVLGSCEPGTPLQCSSSNACILSTCEVNVGCVDQVEVDGTLCDDGDPYSDRDRCESGQCVGEYECVFDADCADSNVCNGEELCSNFHCVAGTGGEGLACDDGDASTVNDQCVAGTCTGEVVQPAPDCSLVYGDPQDIVLTREGDPSTSATVRWTAPANPSGAALQLRWRKSRGGMTLPGAVTQEADCLARYEVRMDNLLPGTRYSFRVSGWTSDGISWSKQVRFNTAGSTTSP